MCDSKEHDNEKEKAYLGNVLAVVHAGIAAGRKSMEAARRSVVEARRFMWENLPHGFGADDMEAIINVYQVRREMNRDEKELSLEAAKLRRLERQANSPYFGRIDFREGGYSQTDAIYVGTFSLTDSDHEALVYDWRAPICSMFYECEVGPAKYECPAGTVTGHLLLKRQYRIAGGIMDFMFDSSLRIDDDVLQEVLARATDERMRTIVSSIQREQNRAIRDEGHRLLVVHGGAGSGKTSVALHRAAYLLYHNRDSMTAASILIFSPNRIFSDYISSVLPELGEENVLQTTWSEFAQVVLMGSWQVEDWPAQMEYLLSQADSPRRRARVSSARLKASPAFGEALERYVAALVERQPFASIEAGGDVVLSAAEQRRLFREEYSFLPIGRRLDKLARRAEALVDEWARLKRQALEQKLAEDEGWLPVSERKTHAREAVRSLMLPVKEELSRRYNLGWMRAYRDLFSKPGALRDLLLCSEGGRDALEACAPGDGLEALCRHTLGVLDGGRVDYEDAAPLLYLRNLIIGAEERSDIKHVIVDEAQDYTPIQYRILRQLFPWANFTVLGDLNQAINPYSGLDTFANVSHELNISSSVSVKFDRTYRSTYEIATFAGQMLAPDERPEPVKRTGPPPEIVAVASRDSLPSCVRDAVERLRAEGCNSVAVVCRTAAEADEAWGFLKGYRELELRPVQAEDSTLASRFVVIPSYLAKGLEFDGVVVWDASAESYHAADRKLLYTICTRALHHLVIFHCGPVTSLLPQDS